MINSHLNITIKGAGIIGLTTAYELCQKNHRITLYDPAGFPNANSASYIAGGMLAPYSEIDLMTDDFITAGLKGIKNWQSIIETLPLPVHFAQTGSIFIAHADDAHMLDRFEQHLPEDSYEKILPQGKESLLPTKFERGLFLKQEASIHPQQAMKSLCAYLQQKSNVTLTTAETKDTDITIDCTGQAAIEGATNLRGVKGEIAIVENPDFSLTHTLRMMHPRYPLYIVPRPDNIFMIGATQIESSNDSSVSVRSAMELLSALYSLHPSFGDAKIHALQAGIRPAYTDNLPQIKRSKNTITVNGLFRHGYLLAPAIAQDITAMLESEITNSLFVREAA